MTIDDDCSIYVGGLPYDATQDTLRTSFSIFGHIVAVKIINDRSMRGKCFGFVTFTNPHSAVDAINDMDGKTIGGRVVKVNDVKSRDGRSSLGRDAFRRDVERGRDWDRGRDYDRGRVNLQGQYRDRLREHDGSRERGAGYTSSHGYDSAKEPEREQAPEIAMVNVERKLYHKRERDKEKHQQLDTRNVNADTDQMDNVNRSSDKDRDQQSKDRNGGQSLPAKSCNLLYNKKGGMDISVKRREDLEKEISHLEERLTEKELFVLDLKRKSEKLEDALVAAKKSTSHHHMLLIKLRKCFVQVKDYSKRLKRSEEELQCLVDSVRIETGKPDGDSLENGVLTNGST